MDDDEARKHFDQPIDALVNALNRNALNNSSDHDRSNHNQQQRGDEEAIVCLL